MKFGKLRLALLLSLVLTTLSFVFASAVARADASSPQGWAEPQPLFSFSSGGPVEKFFAKINLAFGRSNTITSFSFFNVGTDPNNTAPVITAASGLSLQQGAPATTSQIATVSDTGTPVGSLVVTATTVPSDFSVTNIVNNNGDITADIAADCSAATGDNTIVLQVSDGSLTSVDNLIINVTPNAPPELTYADRVMGTGGSATISPSAGPSDDLGVQSITLQSQGTFSGTVSVDGSGTISISNAAPNGAHLITVRITDSCAAITDATFTLTVSDPFPLSVIKAGNGSGTVTSDPAGISCGANCAADFAGPVTLDPIPDLLSLFTRWSGDCTGLFCQLNMDAAKTVAARFSKIGAQSCTFENASLWGLRFTLGANVTPAQAVTMCRQGGGTGRFKLSAVTGTALCETSSKSVNTEPAVTGCTTTCIDGSPCGGPGSRYSVYTTGPEIDLTGNGLPIADGDTTPALADHTDFDSVLPSSGSITRTFTIESAGRGPLTVSNITIGGTDQGDFTLGALTPASPIAEGSSATFTVTFDPSAVGLRTATVTIATNDLVENSYDFAIQGTGTNTNPSITPDTGLIRQQGTPASNSTIATVSDNDTADGSLTVTATTVPAGITVTNIVNTNGTITADVAADCSAAIGDNTVVLEVSDGSLTANANLIVNVTANPAPVLSHGNASILSGGSTSINPSNGPSDNDAVSSIVVQSQGTYTGTISVDNTTGMVSISNAAPVGTHTIIIRATDDCGAATDSIFTLSVTDLPNFCTSAIANGNWSAASTWGCGHVPTASDLVTIQSGHSVTLDVDPLDVMITVNAGGTLTVEGNRTLSTNLLVNGTLNFGAGPVVRPGDNGDNSPSVTAGNILVTGNNVVTVACAGVVTNASASAFVVGNVKKDYCATGSFSFPVGTNTHGNEYSPVGVNVTALGTNPSSLTVKSTYGTVAATPPFLDPLTLDRFWTLTENGDLTADITFNYLSSDVSTAEGSHRIYRITGGTPAIWPNSAPDTANHKATATNVSGFSDWTLAVPQAPTAAAGSINGQVSDSSGRPLEGTAVRLSGTQNRLTVTDALGNYHFDDVETNGFYTVTPSRVNFQLSPAERTFTQLGQQTEGTFTALPTDEGLNPLDTTEYFVRQQYVDFLGREPDEAGLNFWVSNMESCGNDTHCRASKRTDTSAAFFLSIEFQQTGYLVYRTYRTAYGEIPGTPVPLRLAEFKPATAKIGNGVIVNQAGWQHQLELNKQTFAVEFVQRARFVAAYPNTLTPAEFVSRLFANAGVTPGQSDLEAAIAQFGTAATSTDVGARAHALRRVAENSALVQQEFNQAFVLMQYFGYLQRDANTAPDTDFSGYSFWLNKLNSFNGSFQNAEMVKSFLVSGEYRGRFPR